MHTSTFPLPLKRCLIAACVTAITFILLCLLLYIERFEILGREDGIAETISALANLVASVLFFLLFLKSKKAHNEIQPASGLGAWFWYLPLAALFFFIAGEEISWGQRIFEWSTPSWIEAHNVQNETTIHNLEIFIDMNRDREFKPFFLLLFSMNRMYSMFWLSWCFLLPLTVSLSGKVRSIVAWFRVPIPRFLHGCLFLSTFITSKLFVIILQPVESIVANLDEVKEGFYAVIFLMVAWDFFKRWKQRDTDLPT